MASISQLQLNQSHCWQLERNGFPSSLSPSSFLNFEKNAKKLCGKLVVSASPPTEDAVVMTEPLTKDDLVAYLASGCKTKDKWRIGTEHEKFGFQINTLRPMTYEQIAYLLNGIAERFDWEKVMEGDYVIGLKQGSIPCLLIQ